MEGILIKYKLPNGHELFIRTNSKHGVIKAPFACRKVYIIEENEDEIKFEALPGFYNIEECVDWLLDDK